MPYVALRNMSLNKPGQTRTNVSRSVSGLTALTETSQGSGRLPMPRHSGIARNYADHRCGGSAGIVQKNSPDFPLIHPVTLPDGNLHTVANYKQLPGICNKKRGIIVLFPEVGRGRKN